MSLIQLEQARLEDQFSVRYFTKLNELNYQYLRNRYKLKKIKISLKTNNKSRLFAAHITKNQNQFLNILLIIRTILQVLQQKNLVNKQINTTQLTVKLLQRNQRNIIKLINKQIIQQQQKQQQQLQQLRTNSYQWQHLSSQIKNKKYIHSNSQKFSQQKKTKETKTKKTKKKFKISHQFILSSRIVIIQYLMEINSFQNHIN
ncbi:hypothetical protein ABPG72_008564 [Tetrahymena utriculariae]